MRRGELISLQVGLHMAGEALHRRRKSIPPHATTLRPYTNMAKPRGVIHHLENATKPILKEVLKGSLGGGV